MDPLLAVQASANEWSGVANSVRAGTLKMEPNAARECAKKCREAKFALQSHINSFDDAVRESGFGDWPSGIKLANKFYEKATGTPASASEILRLHQQVLENMAKTFDDAAAAYEATEAGNAGAFSGS